MFSAWWTPGGYRDRSSWGSLSAGGERSWADGSKRGVPWFKTRKEGNKMAEQHDETRVSRLHLAKIVEDQNEEKQVKEPPIVLVKHCCKESCSRRTGKDRCDRRRCVRFFCDYCKQYHRHGVPGGLSENEHRLAHCTNPDSPYRKTGYILKLAEKDSRELK
jgi:hypothetical protein